MKRVKSIYIILLSVFILSGCDDDNSGNPSFAADELPKIFMEWSNTFIFDLNEVIKMTPQVSPSDNATYKWTVDGKVVSTDIVLEYTVTEKEPFELKFEVERNGKSTSRTAKVEVIKPFIPKSYTNMVMGVVSESGTADAIPWENITHLLVTSLLVNNESGQLQVPTGDAFKNMTNLVKLAHNQGVYVMVDVAGPMNEISGVGGYDQTSLYKVAINPEKRTVLIKNLKEYVSKHNLDGINISMNSANNEISGLQEQEKLADFMNEVVAAFPKDGTAVVGKPGNFVTASVPMTWDNDVHFKYIANVPDIDWVNLMLFGLIDLVPGQHAATGWVSDHMTKFVNLGVPTSKMLIGIPAFGVTYDIPVGTTPSWVTIDNYITYPKYVDILKMTDADATKDYLEAGNKKTYYTGIGTSWGANVASKIAQMNSVGSTKGMFIWKLDFDSTDQTTSITKAVYDGLNP